MDLHFSSNCTSAFISIIKVAGTTLPTQKVALSRRDEKNKVEREVIDSKVIGRGAGLMMDESRLPHFPSSIQGFVEKHDSLDFCPPCTPSCYLTSLDPTLEYHWNHG